MVTEPTKMLQQSISARQATGFLLMAVGLIGGLTRRPELVLAGGVVSWAGFIVITKGQGLVIRVGGGFVVALGLMVLGISCG